MCLSNILVDTFKMYEEFKDIKFYDENSTAMKYKFSVVCPDVLCNVKTNVAINIYVRGGSDATVLEKFLKFFMQNPQLAVKDDCHTYDINIKAEQNLSLVEKIKDYSIYTINFDLYIKKEKIGG